MKILSLNPGHDGAVVFVDNRKLIFSIEAEKDSNPRYSPINLAAISKAFELANSFPDVIAIGGWHRNLGDDFIGNNYFGHKLFNIRDSTFFGRSVKYFFSTHERSHIFLPVALAPSAPIRECLIIVWEGTLGNIYHWSDFGKNIVMTEVLSQPGARYGSLFALADPSFPDFDSYVHPSFSGKLMALAGFAEDFNIDEDVRQDIERILSEETLYPFKKINFKNSRLYNAGVDTEIIYMAARYITDRIFDIYMNKIAELGYQGMPLMISGGCGLNCEWNSRFRTSGYFSEVFVPPCPNDSGSALGTAVDAMVSLGEECQLKWNVYSGEEFVDDLGGEVIGWKQQSRDYESIAKEIANGEIVAWVQGKYEIGPRALGNRSILASPIIDENKNKLNKIKNRESYRPIAPCVLLDDLKKFFDPPYQDPYMLYFNTVTTPKLPAITHVDGTARPQSVTREDNECLFDLLTKFKSLTGYGVLCNTSLNFLGTGFINRLSDLKIFCESQGINNFIVGEKWYSRN